MGRNVKPELDTDRKRLNLLLRKAQGNTPGVLFAEKCGMTASYLSRITSLSGSILPGPDTLVRIATASDGAVDPNDLLLAAGYDPRIHGIDFDDRAFSSETDTHQPTTATSGDASPADPSEEKQAAADRQMALQAHKEECDRLRKEILQILDQEQFSYRILSKQSEVRLDLELKDAPITQWHFFFLTTSAPEGTLSISEQILAYYGRMASLAEKGTMKISIVVSDSAAADDVPIPMPYRLPFYVSVIRLGTTVSEIYLPSYLEKDRALLTEYSLAEEPRFV